MKSPLLIFDLGSVVLTNDHPFHNPEEAKEFCDYFEIDLDLWLRGWDSSWPQFRIGQIGEDEFWARLLKFSLANKSDLEFAKKFWREHQKEVPGTFEILDKLKGKYSMAALTTIAKEWLDFKTEKFKLDSYFDPIISSGYSGFVKPDRRVYELLLSKIKQKPEDCIFVDDLQRNLDPAEDLGIKTILFDEANQLQRDLYSFGLSF